jgi:hypothetical protein
LYVLITKVALPTTSVKHAHEELENEVRSCIIAFGKANIQDSNTSGSPKIYPNELV